MKIKSKILLFVCAFALIFSVLSVSCFASVEGFVPGERYTIDPNVSLPSDNYHYNLVFTIDGVLCESVEVNNVGVVFYSDLAMFAFVPSLGWVDENTNPLSVDFVTFVSGDFSPATDEQISYLLSIFDPYSEVDPDSFYNQIFNSLSGAVFGEDDLTPEQNLSLSLISTVVSIGVVLLPVLLVIGFLLRCFRL